jgi:hypothetical protein
VGCDSQPMAFFVHGTARTLKNRTTNPETTESGFEDQQKASLRCPKALVYIPGLPSFVFHFFLDKTQYLVV